MTLMQRVCALVLCYTIVLTTVLAPGAGAAVRVVSDDSTEFSQGNKLVLHKEPDITSFDVSTNIGSSRLIDRTDTKEHFDKYHNFQQDYDNVWYEIKSPRASDTVTVNYGNAGTYEGRAVDLQVQYTDMNYKYNVNGTNADGSPRGSNRWTEGSIFLQLSESPYSGFVYYNMSHGTVKYTFSDALTGEKLYLDENSFMTVNSLNGYSSPDFKDRYGSLPGAVGEFVNYKNYNTWEEGSEKDAFLVDGTDMKIAKHNNLNDGMTMFVGYSNDFEDKLGSPTFTNNSVSFQVEGVTQEFTFGSANRNSAWQAPSTAVLFDVTAPEPELEAVSAGDCTITDGAIAPGEAYTYDLEQKVHVLGQDILERYKSMMLTVNLPDGVRYENARVFDDAGNEIDSKFIESLSYNKGNHRVQVKFTDAFLKGTFDSDGEQTGGMEYAGESYHLKIDVMVDSIHNVASDGKIEADASSAVNRTTKLSDPVVNVVVE